MSTDPPAGDTSREALLRQNAELRARLAASAPASVNTQGGATFHSPASVTHGHLIGRDFVQIVQNLFPQCADADRVTLALGAWLDALIADLAHPELGKLDPGIDKTRRQPLELADIYVPLNTTFSLPEGADLAVAARAREPGGLPLHALGERGEPRRLRPATALQALDAHPALTLLGLPGSGKSTFGAHVLLAHAQAWQQRAPLDRTLGDPWRHGVLLPLRVVLRRFAERHAQTGAALNAGDLWAHIAADLAGNGWGSSDDALRDVQTLARRHGALLLFDGLDECGDATLRARVLTAVHDFVAKRSAGPRSRYLLTARPYACPEGADPARGIHMLAALDDGQIGAFATRWYDALVARDWMSQATAHRLRDDLLAANPLLLTMTALLHSNQKRLPDDRADLYDAIVELLLQRWGSDVRADADLLRRLGVPGLTLGQVRGVLERIAFEAHEAGVGTEGSAEIGEHTLIDALRPLLQGSRDKAAQVVEFIEQRAGLLVGLGAHAADPAAARRFSFPHRTFQEFLAACHLQARDGLAQACEQLYAQSFDHWRIVLPLAARLAKAERGALAGNELVRGIDVSRHPRPTPDDWQRALAAGLMLQEIGAGPLAAGAHTTRQTLARVRQWLLAGLPLHPRVGGAPAARRAEMGRVLAALGDPRFDPARLHLPADDDLGFVAIDADPGFRIGTRNGDAARVEAATGHPPDDDELNEDPTPSPAFRIARYPVTVAQFRAYLESTGQAWPGPDGRRDPDHAPVRWVDWHDADSYCGWLQRQLATLVELAACTPARLVRDAAWRVGLPTELEWEKAARGGLDRAVFSWGDDPDAELANIDDSGIGDTSPVGCFAANGYGLHDMIGNVWEWTASDWSEQASLKLVRGGSWYHSLHVARCAVRGRNHPGLRGNHLGFRVVLRSAPVSAR